MILKSKFAIIVSQFNENITLGLRNGAVEALKEHGYPESDCDFFFAPGAFELPLLAQTAAETEKYRAIIALGCVIKGDTAHFEFISLAAAIGIQEVSLKTKTPVSFGILTTYTEEQAIVRSRPGPENKGRESALAVIAALRTISEIQRA